MRRGHPRMEIKTIHDFNDVVGDMLDEFLQDFPNIPGMTREVEEEDCFDEGEVSFMYTQRGMNIYDRYERRLKKLADKAFPEDSDDFCLQCSNMKFA